jgi:hypothetical protein
MPDIITPPDVPGTQNKMLLWVLGLVAGGIVFAASWVASRMNADADFTRKLVEQGNSERAEHLKALTVLGENVRQSSEQTRALVEQTKAVVQSSEATVKLLKDIRDDTRKFPAVREFPKPEQP